MQKSFDATFLFGSLGNLTEALGDGWSVEDNFAWATGEESQLILPLPDDASQYRLRLTVRPLVHPGLREAQRLTVETDAGPLASFSLTDRATIELSLPPEQTKGRQNIRLLLRHPDALRPSDFKQIDDSRLLTVCFLSGTLTREAEDGSGPDTAAGVHLIIAGGHVAAQIAEVVAMLPVLRQSVVCHYVSTDRRHNVQIPAAEILASAKACWFQTGPDETVVSDLRSHLPEGCDLRSFPAPRMEGLWPFLGFDPRLRPEPEQYPGGRYPFGDRIAASLASLQLPDDVLLLVYDSMTQKELPDLDASLAADHAAWQRLDAANDVKVADFVLENFRRHRLFFSPPHPTGEVLRHMVLQLIAGSPLELLCTPVVLRSQLDLLLAGYIGRRMELPILPHVARHFALAWWQPGMRYRVHGNFWTAEEYTLHYLRWLPWRP
ncbi:MAG TPA: WcbI family polysaccharide biosynthesis putative acetyltransferase [Acetobacteraceae bacterium]|nr:WcbI family polysaccharide biosynthesis putative acetyltransferase [Acetobacteraceae bacterium]